MKIAVIGCGAYGIALSDALSKRDNNKIMLWTENDSKYEEFMTNHSFPSILPSHKLKENIFLTKDLEEAIKNSKIIFLTTSAKYIGEIAKKIKPYYQNSAICIASKGILYEELDVLSNVVKRILNTNNICVISGPTFAVDLINSEPAALAIAGLNKKTINLVKDNLANDTLKLRVSHDLIGIQLCGSIKNIIAIASGIIKGLGYHESTQAFLINESLHDMKNIIYKLGGKKKTILSFAGIGDLLLTCSSEKSRNYSFGYVIGKSKSKEEITKYLKENTVEGYYTLNSIYKMLNKKGIEIPLINIIYDIVCNNTDPNTLVNFLITKE